MDGQKDGRTDNGPQVIRKAHLSFSSGELKTFDIYINQ